MKFVITHFVSSNNKPYLHHVKLNHEGTNPRSQNNHISVLIIAHEMNRPVTAMRFPWKHPRYRNGFWQQHPSGNILTVVSSFP
jgi:hypothetical protein